MRVRVPSLERMWFESTRLLRLWEVGMLKFESLGLAIDNGMIRTVWQRGKTAVEAREIRSLK